MRQVANAQGLSDFFSTDQAFFPTSTSYSRDEAVSSSSAPTADQLANRKATLLLELLRLEPELAGVLTHGPADAIVEFVGRCIDLDGG